jgi:hypothetical protein
MKTAVHYRFANEPLAGDSAQFPLARGSHTPTPEGTATPTASLPWNVRGMKEVAPDGERRPMGTYDPVQQVSVDANGRPLAVVVPNLGMSSITNLDGDGQGPGEDWKADFAPDCGN